MFFKEKTSKTTACQGGDWRVPRCAKTKKSLKIIKNVFETIPQRFRSHMDSEKYCQ